MTPISGTYILALDANANVDLGPYVPLSMSLNSYRQLAFSMRTTSAIGTGIAFRIHDASNSSVADAWFGYTVGTDYPMGMTAQVALGGGTPVATWRTFSRNLYDDVRTALPGGTYDDYEITGMQTRTKSGSSGLTYLDAAYLYPVGAYTINEAVPAFNGNAAEASLSSPGANGTANAVKVTPGTLATSPQCTITSCFNGGGLYAYPYANWDWKKVGGTSIAIRYDLKDVRPDSGGTGVYKTGSITYYAGSAPPSDAVNPVQVSAQTPDDWTHVTRNLLEDARQILDFYNDNPSGTAATSPPNGPVGDDVIWTAYVVSAVDGTYALFDNLGYTQLPTIGSASAGAPDFVVTNADRSVHAFNRDGLLTSITDRDGNKVVLDYSYATGVPNSQKSYMLTAIHGPSDDATYDRRIDLSRPAGSVVFTEALGTDAAGSNHITGRSTSFAVSAGDVSSIKPARRDTACAASGTASGCALFSYTTGTSHLLSSVGDPRWDQTSINNSADNRFTIDWTGTPTSPTRVTDKSHNGATGADLLRVLSWDTGDSSLGARVAWQDGPAIVPSGPPAWPKALFSDIIADGRTVTEYTAQTCSSSTCSPLPTSTDAVLSTKKLTSNEFDGLTNVNRTIAYRTPSADPVVTRSASWAGAKVDNYQNPLLGGQMAWQQTPDQLYASLVDSGGTSSDLYRTTYSYDDRGQLTHAVRPVYEANADYLNAIRATTGAIGLWRLDDASGNPVDAIGGATATGANLSYGQPTALAHDAGKSITFNGTSSAATRTTAVSSATDNFSLEAWIDPTALPAATLYKIAVNNGTNAGGWGIGIDSSGMLVGIYGSVAWLTTTAKVSLGVWHHVALVRAAGVSTLYISTVRRTHRPTPRPRPSPRRQASASAGRTPRSGAGSPAASTRSPSIRVRCSRPRWPCTSPPAARCPSSIRPRPTTSRATRPRSPTSFCATRASRAASATGGPRLRPGRRRRPTAAATARSSSARAAARPAWPPSCPARPSDSRRPTRSRQARSPTRSSTGPRARPPGRPRPSSRRRRSAMQRGPATPGISRFDR